MAATGRRPISAVGRVADGLATVRPSMIAFPMHGNQKMLVEGYRTRDAHLVEWFGKINDGRGPIEVVSRPEPVLARMLQARLKKQDQAFNTYDHQKYVLNVPNLRDRRLWWIKSLGMYPAPHADESTPAVVWNPFIATSNISTHVFNERRSTALDLLDDWSIHYAFDSVRSEVERAYEVAFDKATIVTANSEGTVELARRFGRDDVHLIANGVDPERFLKTSTASGRATVGYVGKIGRRVDLELVIDAARALPDVKFVFAGPILDAEYRGPLSDIENVTLLGDVQYNLVPSLLQTFDIGWVPHRVGDFEVGGDVIKTYEYRAAGLPVLSTPVMGAGHRGIGGVTVLDGASHASWLRAQFATSNRISRLPEKLPEAHSWKLKAENMVRMLANV